MTWQIKYTTPSKTGGIKEFRKVVKKLKNTVLIEGLPDIGNVGKIAVDFLIDSLKAKKICEIYSYSFPHSVFINEKNLVELPVIELYHITLKDKNLFLLTGDIQPLDEESCYEFCDKILDIFQEFNGKEVITLSGVALQKIPKRPKVYCTGNSQHIIKKYSVKGLNSNLYGIIGPITGVSGLLIGLAGQRNIPSISLLAETYTHPTYLGVKGAKEILNILNSKLNLKLNIQKLTKEVNSIEKEIANKTTEFNKAIEKQIKEGAEIDYIS